MSKNRKRHLVLLLCLMLCLSLFPAAYAEEGDTEPAAEETAEADVVEEEDAAVPAETEDVIPEAEEEALIAEEETTGERQKSADGLPKLAPPSNVHWTGNLSGEFAFTVNQPTLGSFMYELYRVGQGHRVDAKGQGWYPENMPKELSADFRSELVESGSGDYYVVVYSSGDGKTYSDSDGVQLPVFQ